MAIVSAFQLAGCWASLVEGWVGDSNRKSERCVPVGSERDEEETVALLTHTLPDDEAGNELEEGKENPLPLFFFSFFFFL